MRDKRIRRSVAMLCLLLFFTNVTKAFAIPITDATVNDIKLAISDRLRTNTIDMTGYPDERGLIYYLTTFTTSAMWNEFANSDTDISKSNFSYTENELEPYYNYLVQATDSFNAKYGNKTKELNIPAKVGIGHSDIDNLSKLKKFSIYSQRASDALVSLCEKQGNDVFKDLMNSYKSKKTKDDKSSFLDENSSTIRAVYKMCQRITDEKNQILSYCKITDASQTNAYVYNRDVSNIGNIVSNPDYKDLIDYAKKLMEQDINSIKSFGDLDGNDDFHKLTFKYNLNGKDKLTVNPYYMAMFACSAIYRPFSSKVGEKEFIDSLSAIVSKKQDVIDLYNNEKSKKKPLYYRALNDKGESSGNAERMTVQEFMDSVKNLKSGSLVTFKGKFQKSKDTDAYAFYNKDGFQVYSNDGTPVDTSLNSKGTAPTNNQQNSNSNTNTQDTNNTQQDNSKKTDDKSQQTTTEKTTSQLGAKAVTDDGREIILGDTMTDATIMTDPVFEYGTNYYDAAKYSNASNSSSSTRAATNTMLVYNMLKNSKCTEGIEGLNKKYLYVNTFGDIVLDDDTVVIPASANATYYNKDSSAVYNPMTAAFMNSYPKASLSSQYFTVDDSEKGKMIVNMAKSSNNANLGEADATKDMGQNKIGPIEKLDKQAFAYIIDDNKNSFKIMGGQSLVMPLEMNAYNGGSDKLKVLRAFSFKFKLEFGSILSKATISNQTATLVPNTAMTLDFGEPLALFPLTSSNDEGFSNKCQCIAARMFDSLVTDENGSGAYLNNRMNLERINNIFMQAYNGTENIAMFSKNCMKDYEDKENADKLTKTVTSLAQSILDSVGKSGGVIGLKSAYEDPIFGFFLYNSNKFMIIILALIAVFFIAMYARRRLSVGVAAFSMVLCMGIAYLMLTVIPVGIPNGVNWFINNWSDEVAYKSLIMKQEQYRDVFNDSKGYSNDGQYELGRTTMSLYKLNSSDIKSICNSYSINDYDIISGTSYTVDDSSGLFLQGNQVKLDLEKFLAGVSIVGSYSTGSVDSSYKLALKKHVSSSIDYYTPFYPMMNGFIEKLNRTSSVFNIPASSLPYGNGIFKDSFLVDAYVKSDLFLNGDNLNKLKEQFDPALVQKVKELFGKNNLDYLGLNEFLVTNFSKDSGYLAKVKNTLWYSTMAREGYYDYDTGEIKDSEKMAKLIEKVNKTVKIFLIDNEHEMKFISDENMIKATILYACTEFNREIGYYDDVVYPHNINFEEMKMEDVYLSVLTKDYDKFMAVNKQIVPYIDSDGSWGSVILFIPIMVLAFLISNIMRWGTPILYMLLLIFIVLRLTFFKVDEMKTAIKGYLKIYGTIVGCYILFCIVTSQCYKISNLIICLFILLIVYLIFTVVLLTVILALVTNLTDFGNTNVNAAVKKLGQKAHLNNLTNTIKEAIQSIRRPDSVPNVRDSYKGLKDRYSMYSYDRSVDDIYNDQIQEGVMRKRHSEFEYDGDYKDFDKKRLRKKKVRKDYNKIEYEDDDEGYDIKEDSHKYRM